MADDAPAPAVMPSAGPSLPMTSSAARFASKANATLAAGGAEAKAQAKNWVKVALLGNAKVRARARPGPQYALCCARARA